MKRLYIAAVALLVVGCGKEETSLSSSAPKKIKQELRLNLATEPQTLNPSKARTLSDINVIRMLSDGLTRTDKSGKTSLALAKDVSISPDKKCYTFSLRESKWSNGDPVTAHDFVFAWKQSLSPLYPSDNANLLYPIKNAKAIKQGNIPTSLLGVKAIDDMTLEVRLTHSTPYILELLGHPVYFPINAKVVKKTSSWAENSSTYVSNGPFILKEWKHNGSIRVVKNEDYWDADNVKLASILLSIVTEETGLKMFEMEELHREGSPFSQLPSDSLPTLKKENKLITYPFQGTYFLRVNTTRAPFDSPLMRKAFALAINRKHISEHITSGTQTPATTLVPEAFNLHTSPLFSDGDVAKAKELFTKALKESGLKAKKLPEITLMYPMLERSHKIAQAIQSQLKEALGIDVKLQQVERKVHFSSVSKGDFQLAAGDWQADFNDPINFLQVFEYKTNGTNNTGWEHSKYIELLEKSYETSDPIVRNEYLRQSEELLIDEMPVIPIFNHSMCYVEDKRIKDVALNDMGLIDFKFARLEE